LTNFNVLKKENATNAILYSHIVKEKEEIVASSSSVVFFEENFSNSLSV